MPQGQAAMRAARARHDAANPDAVQRRRESAAASYRKNRDAAKKRRAELWDQRMDALRQFGLVHGVDLFDVGSRAKARSTRQW